MLLRRKKILSIPGSTRQHSANLSLIKAIEELSKDYFDMEIYTGIVNLPQYNPDEDVEDVAKEVAHFRKLISDADGVLICTPEYARGVPGTLKNAIDWTISSSGFPHKPTLLITASTDGSFGHRALMDTLMAIEAMNIRNLQMVIPFVKTKVGVNGEITDPIVLDRIKSLIKVFNITMDKKLASEQ